MAIADRWDKTGTVKSVAEQDDGYGGMTKAETTVVTGYPFGLFSMSAFTQQQELSRLGLQKDADLKRGTGEAHSLTLGCIIEVSATERYKVLGVMPQIGKGGVAHHYAFLALKEVQ